MFERREKGLGGKPICVDVVAAAFASCFVVSVFDEVVYIIIFVVNINRQAWLSSS
jgi:hypothetical protein